jgi:two-component system chemotaxis response regulator CheB
LDRLKKVILIGSSTGGPSRVKEIIKNFPFTKDSTIIIAQHMGNEYVDSFANSLENSSEVQVGSVKNGEKLQGGKAYICKASTTIKKQGDGFIFVVDTKAPIRYSPDIDTLFISSLCLLASAKVLCVVLTGIGEDGARGMQALVSHGAKAISESERSSIVYGMPKKAKELTPEAKSLDIEDIADEVYRFASDI